jgi:LTXXQ motif family protein
MSFRRSSLALGLLVGLSALPASQELAFGQAAAPAPAAQAPRPLPPSRIEGRLAFLKTELKITDAQTAQWNAVAEVMRQQAKARRDRFEQMRQSRDPNVRPSALDGLQRQQAMTEQRAQELKQLVVVFQPLYASLSDDQKKTADELFGGRGRHHGFHGRR